MMLLSDIGLVLEGGGMRGVFTCGVLDAFMKYDVHFPYIVGVSAGACHGLSYVSNQPGRARYTSIDMLEKYDYISLKTLFRTGCIFDPDILYDEAPNKIYPYDYDTYFKQDVLYEQVVTNCQTGFAEYLSEHSGNNQRLLDICHASSSLPYVSKIITVDGKPYLDGGIVDSIPLQHAIEKEKELFSPLSSGEGLGVRPKNVVVLTRNKGWREGGKDRKLPHIVYKNFPRLKVALSHRRKVYNEQMDFVDQMEAEGKITVIRPIKPIVVGRMEKNLLKLEDLYQEGLTLGEAFCKTLL